MHVKYKIIYIYHLKGKVALDFLFFVLFVNQLNWAYFRRYLETRT
jgi:hypothetical protein